MISPVDCGDGIASWNVMVDGSLPVPGSSLWIIAELIEMHVFVVVIEPITTVLVAEKGGYARVCVRCRRSPSHNGPES